MWRGLSHLCHIDSMVVGPKPQNEGKAQLGMELSGLQTLFLRPQSHLEDHQKRRPSDLYPHLTNRVWICTAQDLPYNLCGVFSQANEWKDKFLSETSLALLGEVEAIFLWLFQWVRSCSVFSRTTGQQWGYSLGATASIFRDCGLWACARPPSYAAARPTPPKREKWGYLTQKFFPR